MANCKHCGNELRQRVGECPSWFRRRIYCNQTCARAPRPISEKTRYRATKREGKRLMLHRALMEEALGRRLGRDEIVHHIDGNRLNNALENLVVMSAKEHAMHHNQKHPLERPCLVCGRTFTPKATKRGIARACGRACGNKLIGLVLRGEIAPQRQSPPRPRPRSRTSPKGS